MSAFSFRTVSATSRLSDVIAVLQRAMLGGLNATGTLTLAASPATTTTVMDKRISSQSAIVLTPTSSNAAAAVSGTWVSATSAGISFTLTHASSSASDRSFNYAIIG